MQTILTKAGTFDVESIPCRYYAGPTNLAGPKTGVLHTTEGDFDSSLAEFKQKFAPHFLISADRIAQLVPIGMSGASLVTHNNAALVQIELVAYSKEQLWFPDDATAARLAAVLSTCFHLFGIPLSRPFPDGVWGRYGDNPNRHANKWGVESGWFGHGDVPSPDSHWDPGNLEWSRLFDLAKSLDMLPALQAVPDGPVGHAEIAPSPAPVTAAPPLIILTPWPALADDPAFFNAAALVFNCWKSYGASNPTALAMTAQPEAESSINPKAIGDNGTAFNLYQHHGARCDVIKAATGIDLRTESSIPKVISAVHWELTKGPEQAAWAKITAATTARDASIAACVSYERAGAPLQAEKRGAMGERLADFFSTDDGKKLLAANPAPAP